MNLKQLTENLFEAGSRAGFSEMEAFITGENNLNLRVFRGEIDSYSVEDGRGLGFRGLVGDTMGYSYTEKVDESSVEMLVKDALENASVVRSDAKEVIFGGSPAYPQVETVYPALDEVAPRQKIDLAMAIDREARGADERVSIVQSMVQSGRRRVSLFNTRGVALDYEANGISAGLQVVVRQGNETKTAWEFEFFTDLAQLDAAELARKAVTEAVSLLGAGTLPSGRYPVVFRYNTAATMLETFVSSFSAENVQKGMSLLEGKIGQAIASELVTIMDDPLLPLRRYTRPFDGEGVASQTKAVVEGGVLRTHLHNLKTATKAGVESTGNASRASYKSSVGVSPSNMYIAKGACSYDELLKKMDRGVIVISLAGTHSGANPISGDFSLGAEGYLVEGGQIIRPLKQFTIAGNFFRVLQGIVAIGDDLEFGMGHIGAPSVLVEELAVGGE